MQPNTNERQYGSSSIIAIATALAVSVQVAPEINDAHRHGFDVAEATIADIHHDFEHGLTSEQLWTPRTRKPANFTLLTSSPDPNSIQFVSPNSTTSGPLHGVPILFNDNIGTGDKMMTTAGSCTLTGSKVPRDSFIARQLRRAGAVVLGKCNLSEWANFRVYNSEPLFEELPRWLPGTRITTPRSIIASASVSGLAAMKPTVGLTSRSGIIPITHNQDSAGGIVGVDRSDSFSLNSRGKFQKDYTKFLKKGRPHWYSQWLILQHRCAGVPANHLDQAHRDGQEARCPLSVKNADIPSIPSKLASIGAAEIYVMLNDFKHLHRLPGPLLWQPAQQDVPGNACLGHRLTRTEGIDAVRRSTISMPSSSLRTRPSRPSLPPPSSVTPTSTSWRLPFVIGFIGKAYNEPTLIKFAYAQFMRGSHPRLGRLEVGFITLCNFRRECGVDLWVKAEIFKFEWFEPLHYFVLIDFQEINFAKKLISPTISFKD
ncbi:amidase [Jimgerdemannia flammicorona]|uniref:Amidase n=1 Tax=Jimgerdemannia flammicorona TaxID=994334 RepID=A0A433D540_9FUNG|nr:amidase [Jimgerdemannia flammicorona]